MDKPTPFSLTQVQSVLDSFSVGKVITINWLEAEYVPSIDLSRKIEILKAVINTSHGTFHLIGIDPVLSPFHGIQALQDSVGLESATLVHGANNTFLTHRFDLYFYVFKTNHQQNEQKRSI
jgi:hypothetical protein